MHFDWPTSQDILYRAMRLRRLIGVATLLPVAVILTMSLLDPAALSPARATGAAIGIAALVACHVVVFPKATVETISLSISATALALVLPVFASLATWVPAPHQSAALLIVVALAVLAAGVLMALLQYLLGVLVSAGPAVSLRRSAQVMLPCAPARARQLCALQPNTRRGRVLTGAADRNGFFDVTVTASCGAGGTDAAHAVAKVLHSCAQSHHVMLVSPKGTVTVTAQRFFQMEQGCKIKTADLQGDCTLGLHALIWLTDHQADHLTELTEVISGHANRAIGLSHDQTFTCVAAALLAPKAPVTDQAK